MTTSREQAIEKIRDIIWLAGKDFRLKVPADKKFMRGEIENTICDLWANHLIGALEPLMVFPDEGYVKLAEKRPKIVCLCGSTRFIKQFAIMSWEFEKQGYICLGLHYLPPEYTKAKDHLAEAENVKEHFDNLHLRKIDLADEVFVLNIDGYIGESTRREIEYAKSLNKPIRYLETA